MYWALYEDRLCFCNPLAEGLQKPFLIHKVLMTVLLEISMCNC